MGINNHRPWYMADKKDAHKRLHETVDQIRTNQAVYREDVKHFQRLYYNYNVSSTGGYSYSDTGRLRYNLTAAVVDTAASLLAANRPVPFYQTTLGDWNLQRKAKRKSQVVAAQFNDLGVFKLMPKIIYDGLITGMGVVRGYVDPTTGLPQVERVRPLALVFDHDEAMGGNPRSAYLIHTMSREVLQAMYPHAKEALEKSNAPGSMDRTDFDLRQNPVTADQVLIIEAWHLPSVEGWDDGRHCITADNVSLIDERFDRQRFPLAIFGGWRMRDGMGGMGIVERVASEQAEINDLIAYTQELRRRGTNAYVALEQSSEVEDGQLTNLPMNVIRYNTVEPKFHVFDAVPPGLNDEIERIVQHVLFREGLTDNTVAGDKQDNVSSAVGIRATDDIQSRRQILPIRAVEDWAMDVAQLICDMNDEAAEANPKHTVMSRVRKARSTFLQSSRWRDLDIPEGDVRIGVFPISSMPNTPQGRWAASEEWVNKGWVDKGFAMELMQFPDLDAFASLETASLDLICSDLESILDSEEDIAPDPMLGVPGLMQAAKVGLSYYWRAKLHKAEPSVLQALRGYIAATKQTIDIVQPPAPPAPPEQLQGIGPGAMAALPPTTLPMAR